MAFALRDGLAALAAIGVDPQVLRLSGGGTLRPEWRQLLADVLGKPLEAVAAASSAQGAALLAGLVTGVYEDPASTAALLPAPEPVAEPRPQPALEQAYAHYGELYPALRRER